MKYVSIAAAADAHMHLIHGAVCIRQLRTVLYEYSSDAGTRHRRNPLAWYPQSPFLKQ